MGGDAHRRAVHHSAVVHYDNVGVRQVFQAVPLYRNRSRPSFFFAGEPSQNVGRSFIKSYCADRACLHYLFGVCGFPARGQSRCGCGHDGVELYRGTGIQYARPCRRGQDGRPCRA